MEACEGNGEWSQQFCEKLYHFAEEPDAISSFNQHEFLLLLQFLINGCFLNEKHELCFYIGKSLCDYLKNFTLDEFSLAEAREQLKKLREKDEKERVDFVEAVSNYVNYILEKHLKQ